MGWVGMGRLFLVTFAANLPLGNTQQGYSPSGIHLRRSYGGQGGGIAVSLTTIPTRQGGRRRVRGPGLQGDAARFVGLKNQFFIGWCLRPRLRGQRH